MMYNTQRYTSVNDKHLANALKNGAVGVLPTDTVYGLVARAADETAVRKLYATKQRESQPGTIIAADIKQLVGLGFNEDQLRTASRYWPARLSVVLDASSVPAYLKHVRIDLPVRIPDNKALRRLLSKTGPLMTTSANAPGEPTAGTLVEAEAYFGEDVDFYTDGGDLRGNPPSTIIGFDPEGNVVLYGQGAVDLAGLPPAK